MSSNFLLALTRVKETMENASTHLSRKLQMNLSSTQSVSCSTTSLSMSQPKVNRNDKLGAIVKNDPKKSMSTPRNSSDSIKYSDPVLVSPNVKSSTRNLDIQDFVISKPVENTKFSEPPLISVSS